MLRGTSWTLIGLSERDELNGVRVTAVAEFDHAAKRARVRTPAGEYFRVRLERLQSVNDPDVNAKTFLDAAERVRECAGGDKDMATFVSRWESGDHDGALSAATTWTLRAMAPAQARHPGT
tara:strand:- start:800 stop:1162 length:363 start_codon:yes stop_codon:yes gene_type:complete